MPPLRSKFCQLTVAGLGCRMIRAMVLNTDMMYHFHLVSSFDAVARRCLGSTRSFPLSALESVESANADAEAHTYRRPLSHSISRALRRSTPQGSAPEPVTDAVPSKSSPAKLAVTPSSAIDVTSASHAKPLNTGLCPMKNSAVLRVAGGCLSGHCHCHMSE